MKLHSLIFILAAILSLGAWDAVASVYFSGQVFRKDSHTPVSGATIQLYRATAAEPLAVTQTLRNGSYVLKAPSPGSYRVRITAAHFLPFSSPVKILKNLPQLFNAPLTRAPMLMLLLNTPPGEPPVTGTVRVTTWIQTGDWQAQVGIQDGTVSPGGLVELDAPAVTPLKTIRKLLVEVTTEHSGCGHARVEDWPQTPIKVPLAPGLSISGQTVDAQGKPQAGDEVTATRILDGDPLWSAEQPHAIRSDADGRFTVGPLFADPYLIIALVENRKKFWPDVDYRVVNPSIQNTDIRLIPHSGRYTALSQEYLFNYRHFPSVRVLDRLDPLRVARMATVTGRVRDKISGKPMPGVSLSLMDATNNQLWDNVSWDMAKTADDGAYLLRVRPSTKYRLRVENSQFFQINQMVRTAAAGPTTTNIILTRRKTALLKLVGVDGKTVTTHDVETWVTEDGVESLLSDNLWPAINAVGTIEITEPDPTNDLELHTPHAPKSSGPKGVVIGARSSSGGYAVTRLTAWPPGPVTLMLKPGATLSGVLTDAAGKPVPNTNVFVNGIGPPTKGVPRDFDLPIFMTRNRTDAHGRFRILHLPPGDYDASAILPREEDCRSSVAIPEGVSEIHLNLKAAPPVPAPPAGHPTLRRHSTLLGSNTHPVTHLHPKKMSH